MSKPEGFHTIAAYLTIRDCEAGAGGRVKDPGGPFSGGSPIADVALDSYIFTVGRPIVAAAGCQPAPPRERSSRVRGLRPPHAESVRHVGRNCTGGRRVHSIACNFVSCCA